MAVGTSRDDTRTGAVDVDVAFDVPRDPGEFRPSQHFIERYDTSKGQGCKTRTDPEITSNVIRTCITEGTLRKAKGRERYKYCTRVDGHYWELCVALKESAFENDLLKHTVITAYVPGVHSTRGDQ